MQPGNSCVSEFVFLGLSQTHELQLFLFLQVPACLHNHCHGKPPHHNGSLTLQAPHTHVFEMKLSCHRLLFLLSHCPKDRTSSSSEEDHPLPGLHDPDSSSTFWEVPWSSSSQWWPMTALLPSPCLFISHHHTPGLCWAGRQAGWEASFIPFPNWLWCSLLPFCGPNVLDNFYCEQPLSAEIACTILLSWSSSRFQTVGGMILPVPPPGLLSHPGDADRQSHPGRQGGRQLPPAPPTSSGVYGLHSVT